MNKKMKVLQIGVNNWEGHLTSKQQQEMEWNFFDIEKSTDESGQALIHARKKRTFDVVLCTDQCDDSLLITLSPLIESYALILDTSFESQLSKEVLAKKRPVFMPLSDRAAVLETIQRYFFPGQMGSKIHVHRIAVDERFNGEVTLLGEHRLILKGDFLEFGKNCPVLTWQYNIGMFGRSKKIWLEFEHDEEVKLTLTIRGIREGTSQVLETWIYDDQELQTSIEIPYQQGLGYLSVSLSVEGEGEVYVGPLHYRDSRGPYGEYLLGGEKVVDAYREELYYYFHPGDLKPPLNVYFSGYRSAEGFEGFYMMKRLGAPFLLITDPRLEGGSFYLGSPSLESSLQDVISSCLNKLGFSKQELILSGLSMGTFGALYYGSLLQPHSIVVGKPLVNLGSMAEKERLVRPGGFPTSLDILQSLTSRQDREGMQELNQRFWTVFDQALFDQTQFVIAYMKDDDYDDQAYGQILEHLMNKEARVIGKGIPGRHNDNSSAINQWFINHYQRILEENFYRGGAV